MRRWLAQPPPNSQLQSPWQPEGIADRVLRNTFTTAWDGRPGNIEEHRAELRRELEAGAQRGDASVVDISAGVA